MLTRPQWLVLGVAGAVGIGLALQPIGILRNGNKSGPAATATRDGGSNGRAVASADTARAADGASGHVGDGTAGHLPPAAETSEEAPHRVLAPADQQAVAKLRTAFRAEQQPASRAGRAAELAQKT